MSVRYAEEYDIPELLKLEEESFTSDLIDEPTFKKFVKNNRTSNHMLIHGVGLIHGYILVLTRRHASRAIIHSFAVAVESRGLHVGTSLIEEACKIAKTAGYAHIMTHVRVDNPHAISRYKKSGFKIVGAADNYYEDGCDAVKYSRKLT